MNLFANSCNPISNLHEYIFLDKYTYKNIILYIVKLSFMFINLFTNILLCLSLTHLSVEPEFRLEIDLFAK